MTTMSSPAPVGAPSRRRTMARPLEPGSFAPVILSVSVVAALSRLMAHHVSARVLVPLVAAVLIADLVTAVAVRLRVNAVLAAALGCALSLWGLLIIVDPSLFNPASAQFFHGGGFSRQLRAARTALADDGTPLPSLDGVIVLIGAVGGLAAGLTRGIWSRRRRRHAAPSARPPLSPCLAPSLAIFVYTTLVSAEQGRVAAFVSYFLGVLAFVALADRTAAPRPAPSLSSGSTGSTGSTWRRRPRMVAGVLAGSLLVSGVVIAAGDGLSGMRLTVFHVVRPQSGASPSRSLSDHGVPQSPLTGIALVDHLLATELSESNVVIFRAHSPVTTYWQVGNLSSFTGTEWLPTSDASGALAGSPSAVASLGPAALPAPAPGRTFTAQVGITDFFSRLLPAPPDTVAVHGLSGSSTIDQEGVLAAAASTPGTRYTVTAALAATVPSTGPQLIPTDPRLAPYVALPAEPAVVARLAHQAVGQAGTPAAKAQALVNWFRSGRFRYTLSPPPTSGSDPLVQFLTVTRAGFCQQFAGAYGVLARTLGIPTRLVVGFTSGQAGPNQSFTVTGADAHVWPQVYLGPDAGWVSVEPTPSAVAGAPSAEGVLGAAGTGTTTTALSPKVPTTVPGVSKPAGSKAASTRTHHHPTPRHHGGATWWIPALVLLVLLALLTSGLLVRRRRHAAAAALQPDQRVVRAWELALGALRKDGFPRHAQETPGEYATRVRTAAYASAPSVEGDAVADLAALVEVACYTPLPCSPGQVDQAYRLASTIVQASRPHRRRPVTTRRMG
jgi:transglutaminase-like putative cysteine protease